MSERHARPFFRIVRGPVATLEDFFPAAALGKPRPRNPDLRRPWAEGISVYDDVDWARTKWAKMPRLGSFLAEVVVEAGSAIVVEQVGADPRHFALYGTPAELLTVVRRVVPA